jgi:hypothetical protein
MTHDEAMRINDNLLEGERPDALTNWRASMPPPEPPKRERGLDTAPTPQVDWSAVIHGALKAERTLTTESVGGALGEVRNALLDEFEAAIEKVRAEFRREVDQLREQFSQAREVQSLRTELVEIKALLTARSRKPAAPPQLPAVAASNGDARPQ